MKICFVAPNTRAFVSGGNIYNRHLIQVLGRMITVERMDPERFFAVKRKNTVAVFDSICLDQLFTKGRKIPPGSLLLMHYLPVFEEKHPSEEKRLATEKMLKRFAGWIVTGAYTRNWLQTHIRSPRPIALIPPAIARIKKINSAPPPPYRVLVAGNLILVKGLIPLLRALEKVKPRQLQITLAGDDRLDPAYAGMLQEMVNRSSYLSKQIRFHKAGGRSKYLKLLGSSHLLISASRFETFGMAVHEALYNGVPVWALPSGNLANISHPLFQKFSSVGRLAESLNKLPEKLMAERSMVQIEKRYGWKNAAEGLVEFIGKNRALHPERGH